MGAVIILAMKKEPFYPGCRYGFGVLLTHFLRGHEFKEEALYYRLVVDTRLMDVTRTWGLDITHGLVLTLPKHHAQDDEITAHMYEM